MDGTRRRGVLRLDGPRMEHKEQGGQQPERKRNQKQAAHTTDYRVLPHRTHCAVPCGLWCAAAEFIRPCESPDVGAAGLALAPARGVHVLNW